MGAGLLHIKFCLTAKGVVDKQLVPEDHRTPDIVEGVGDLPGFVDVVGLLTGLAEALLNCQQLKFNWM